MKKLLELEEKLRKAKEDLEKSWLGGTQTSGQTGGVTQGSSGSGSGPSIAEQIGFGKKEDKDEKEDKKMIEEKLDEHNEEKHGEAKDVDSAKKNEDCVNMIKFEKNGQWSLTKGSMDLAPEGKYKATHKEVMDGDDKFKERGGKSVDGEKGKTIKVADKEAKDLKSL